MLARLFGWHKKPQSPAPVTLGQIISSLNWARMRGFEAVPGYTIAQWEDDERTQIYVTVMLRKAGK